MAPSLTLACAGAAVAALGGLPALATARWPRAAARLAAWLAVLGSLLGLSGALLAMAGDAASATAAWPVPGGSLALGLDGLSALFLVPVFLVPALAAIYGLGYEPAGSARAVRPFQGLLCAGMALLVLARNGLLFLVGWEAMALAAFFLIATEHQKAAARQAAWVYLVATHLGTAALIAAFALLQQPDGSLDWSGAWLAQLPPGRALTVLLLGLLGFGLKAGLMPLHVWLPAAHANAPSHVSAVLSGVMIKMGAYGRLRLLALLPPPPAAFGALLLLLGTLSALLGVAATLGQRDLKRLLAYSSIENIGIVGMGIGLSALGKALGRDDVALLGLCAALLHVLNHSLFKPLLFLAAGAVIHATGTRELDELGGLWRRMPRTGACFLVGAGAITGLPLLNGFLGEFALYRGLFAAAAETTTWVALLAVTALAGLALVSGLALVAFVRCAATVFLGRPRSAAAAAAHEAPASMTAPLLVLAALCALLGLLPQLALPLLAPATGADAGALAALLPLPALCAIALGCTAALALLLPWLRRRWRPAAGDAARVGTWDCGYVDASPPRLQYTGSSFAQFAAALLAWTVRERGDGPGQLDLFPAPRAFAREPEEPLLQGVLWPLGRRLAERCSRLRFLQHGKLQLYLLYILVVLLLLLGWSLLTAWARP